MSVTCIAPRQDKLHMISGSRDCTTRVWDLETKKTVTKRKLARNVVTGLKWIPAELNCFIEISEDLFIRIWDIRVKPFKPTT